MERRTKIPLICWAGALIILLFGTVVNQANSSSLARQTPTGAEQNALVVSQFGGQVSPTETGYLLIGPTSTRNLASIDLGQKLLYGPNANKRASRRVSSFMPMRGRKDGRDDRISVYSQAGGHEPETEYYYVAAAGTGEEQASGSELMQAKLRRAFHPMRGKKSDSSLVDVEGEFVEGLES